MEKIPRFSVPSDDSDDTPWPKQQEKVYKPDGSGLQEVPEAGYARPSEMNTEPRIVGERKVFRGTRMVSIPIKRMHSEPSRQVKEGIYDEEDHHDYILQKPVYEDDAQETKKENE